jgi:hypothetical protein
MSATLCQLKPCADFVPMFGITALLPVLIGDLLRSARAILTR